MTIHAIPPPQIPLLFLESCSRALFWFSFLEASGFGVAIIVTGFLVLLFVCGLEAVTGGLGTVTGGLWIVVFA